MNPSTSRPRGARVWRWVLLGIAVLAALSWWGRREMAPSIADGSVLVVELSGDYGEAPVNPLVGRLFGRREHSLLSLLGTFAKAERDPRITAVAIRVRDLSIGWGRAEEIRTAIRRLSEAGRHTVAYLEVEGFGSLEYFVASGAERVVASQAGRAPFVGLAAEYLFFGGLFEKLGVQVEYERVGRFKSAVEAYAGRGMSGPSREMATSLLDSVDGRFVGAIADARHLTQKDVRAAIDQGPASPEAMQALGLVDEVGDFETAQRSYGERPLVKEEDYERVDPTSVGFAPKASFALITGEGAVMTGEGSVGPSGRPVFASDTLAKALRDAAAAPDISAIVFRIDSPGGSALASDIVWRAVRDARAAGKPVVASFSDVAASGGYYAACGADAIVSQPTTYTGSIGVFTLRPVLGGLLEKLGIGVETMQRGDRADLLLATRPLSPASREVLRRDVQGIYELFVSRVAEGRSMSPEAVDAIGQGRVWTGEQALGIGLVDELGGLRDAVRRAKGLAHLQPDDDVVLVPYPPPRPLAEQLAELLSSNARAWLLPPLPGALADLAALVEGLPAGAPLLLPPGLVEIR